MSRERACEWRTPSLYGGVQKYCSILLSAISSPGFYLYDNTHKVNQELIGVDNLYSGTIINKFSDVYGRCCNLSKIVEGLRE